MDTMARFARRLGFVFLAPLLANASSPPSSTITIHGRVLYSFSEPHALVQTDRYVVRIVFRELDVGQRNQLKQVGAQVKLTLPGPAVDLVWPVNPNENEALVVEDPKRPTILKEVKDGRDQVRLDGKVLDGFGKSDKLIQVGSYIYRINTDALAPQTLSKLNQPRDFISITLPTTAVIFAWKANPDVIKERLPANSDQERAKFLKDEVVLKGRSVASFTEPHVLIQAAGRIYQLRKKFLSANDLTKTSRVGSEVALNVPKKAIEYYWSSEP